MPTSPATTDDAILRALRRIIRAVDLYSRRLAHRHTLTGPQLVCLRRLYKDGPLTPGALAREVSLSPATVTGICDRLEARGLLTRTRRSEDKRQVSVALTDAGMTLAVTLPSPLHEQLLKRLAQLPVAEQMQIADGLQRVAHMMEADDTDNAPLYGLPPETADELAKLLPATPVFGEGGIS